jgi:hypothetical protein
MTGLPDLDRYFAERLAERGCTSVHCLFHIPSVMAATWFCDCCGLNYPHIKACKRINASIESGRFEKLLLNRSRKRGRGYLFHVGEFCPSLKVDYRLLERPVEANR